MTSSDGICEICGEKRAFFEETPEGQICRECDTWHCNECMDWGKSDESGCKKINSIVFLSKEADDSIKKFVDKKQLSKDEYIFHGLGRKERRKLR